jgi:hypothetical protein
MWQLSLLRRRLTGLVVLAVTFAASEACAQSPDLQHASVPGPSIAQSGGLEGPGGIPENTIPGTSIPLFNRAWASEIGDLLARMKDAAAKCDRYAYDAALADYNDHTRPSARLTTRQEWARQEADQKTLRRYRDESPDFPDYPASCAPPSLIDIFLPGGLWLLGGSVIGMSGTGAATGVDTFFGPGSYLVDNRPASGAQQAMPFAGARARLAFDTSFAGKDTQKARAGAVPPGDTTGPSQAAACAGAMACAGPGLSLGIFAELGIQSAFGANSFVQNFSGVSGTPMALGQQTVRENVQIPILIGISIPLVEAAAKTVPLFLDLYAGITLDSWTQTLSGREAGAPGGPGFNGSNDRFTVDPTLGIGLRTAWGDINGDGVADILWGLSTEVQFRPGSVATAHSANFPSETYYGTVDPRANMLIMGRVGVAFGRK